MRNKRGFIQLFLFQIQMQQIHDPSQMFSNVNRQFVQSLRTYSPQRIKSKSKILSQSKKSQCDFKLSNFTFNDSKLALIFSLVTSDLHTSPLKTLPYINKLLNDPSQEIRKHIALHIFNPEPRSEYGKFLLSQNDFWIILKIYFFLTHQIANDYTEYISDNLKFSEGYYLNNHQQEDVEQQYQKIKKLMLEQQVQINQNSEQEQRKSKVTFSFQNEINAKQSSEKKSNLKKWRNSANLLPEEDAEKLPKSLEKENQKLFNTVSIDERANQQQSFERINSEISDPKMDKDRKPMEKSNPQQSDQSFQLFDNSNLQKLQTDLQDVNIATTSPNIVKNVPLQEGVVRVPDKQAEIQLIRENNHENLDGMLNQQIIVNNSQDEERNVEEKFENQVYYSIQQDSDLQYKVPQNSLAKQLHKKSIEQILSPFKDSQFNGINQEQQDKQENIVVYNSDNKQQQSEAKMTDSLKNKSSQKQNDVETKQEANLNESDKQLDKINSSDETKKRESQTCENFTTLEQANQSPQQMSSSCQEDVSTLPSHEAKNTPNYESPSIEPINQFDPPKELETAPLFGQNTDYCNESIQSQIGKSTESPNEEQKNSLSNSSAIQIFSEELNPDLIIDGSIQKENQLNHQSQTLEEDYQELAEKSLFEENQRIEPNNEQPLTVEEFIAQNQYQQEEIAFVINQYRSQHSIEIQQPPASEYNLDEVIIPFVPLIKEIIDDIQFSQQQKQRKSRSSQYLSGYDREAGSGYRYEKQKASKTIQRQFGVNEVLQTVRGSLRLNNKSEPILIDDDCARVVCENKYINKDLLNPINSDQIDDIEKLIEEGKLRRSSIENNNRKRSSKITSQPIIMIEGNDSKSLYFERVKIENILEDNLAFGMFAIGQLSSNNPQELLDIGRIVLLQKRRFDELHDEKVRIAEAWSRFKYYASDQKTIFVPLGSYYE